MKKTRYAVENFYIRDRTDRGATWRCMICSDDTYESIASHLKKHNILLQFDWPNGDHITVHKTRVIR